MATLLERRRLRTVHSVAELRAQSIGDGAIELPITGEIAIRAAELGALPGDPADRFIVATAIIHDAVLVTADERLLKWKHPLKRHDARH